MNSFLRKVDAERSVLSVVNSYTTGSGQLSGLSGLSIYNWCSFHNISTTSHVSVRLHSLADLCNSLSDRSNESFVKLPIERHDRIKIEILMLNKILKSNFTKNK